MYVVDMGVEHSSDFFTHSIASIDAPKTVEKTAQRKWHTESGTSVGGKRVFGAADFLAVTFSRFAGVDVM